MLTSLKKNNVLLIIFLTAICQIKGQKDTQKDRYITVFEESQGTETPTYSEVISFYKSLASTFGTVTLHEIGTTDSGNPLHYAVFGAKNNTDFESIRKNKRIILINNGIHPGESDGIDATLLLFRDLAKGTITAPKNTIIVAIPVYNIGGALNRNSTTRTNQNGPKNYGFRGNSRNYDLNRDFIKNDTKNAQSFAQLFHLIQPDLFIDTHTSNGADYQYTLTHLFTQHNKLGGALGNYLNTTLQPELEKDLAAKKWDITPYVNVWGTTPDKGWTQFMDSPRYSTGYTSLWNTLGLMIETHMLKPYKQRVLGTYEILASLLAITEKEGVKMRELKNQAFEAYAKATSYPVRWEVDSTQHTKIQFKGYEAKHPMSQFTGGKRLKYFQDQPYKKEVTYYNYFKTAATVTVPKAYIIPQGWWTIMELLELNDIKFKILEKDTTIAVEVYHINDYNTRTAPYEGHYLHYDTQLKTSKETVTFSKGDYLVHTDQKGFRYLLETLEPEAVDSFFNWNFFDAILQQKEGFSAYVWEDKAQELLSENTALAKEFTEMKKDTAFAKNSYKQLDWLHKKSPNYEKAHLRYPVYRLLD